MANSLSKLQIMEYYLTPQDKQILRILKDTKCLFTYHIRRVCFTDSATPQAAARATNRHLKKLRDLGLVDSLVNRRIGGVRAGSASYIWYLTEQGNRLLNLDTKYSNEKPKRTRFHEPADNTLCHQMAIAEFWVQLVELGYKLEDFTLEEAEFEPANWRYYQYGSKSEILKPDLLVALSHHQTDYRWFIEIDLGTEAITTIINKCIRYHKYLQSGIEQQTYGVFPAVLWIVKDEARKQKLEKAIRRELKTEINIFIIATADELESIITAEHLPADRLI